MILAPKRELSPWRTKYQRKLKMTAPVVSMVNTITATLSSILHSISYYVERLVACFIIKLFLNSDPAAPQIGVQPDADLVNTILDAAIETVANKNDRPMVHSDRGAQDEFTQYRWPGWLSRMRDARLIRSMSRKGCSPVDAACEGSFGRLKTEMFYPNDWRSTTIEQFIDALDGYFGGTTRSGLNSPLAISVRSSTARALAWLNDINQSKKTSASPVDQFWAGTAAPATRWRIRCACA